MRCIAFALVGGRHQSVSLLSVSSLSSGLARGEDKSGDSLTKELQMDFLKTMQLACSHNKILRSLFLVKSAMEGIARAAVSIQYNLL